MSKTVYKYPLAITDVTILSLTGQVLYFAEQHGRLTIWAEHDQNVEPVLRQFQVVGTGHPVPDDGRFLGSTVTTGGHFVFHLYEVTP